jgi:acetyl esterase
MYNCVVIAYKGESHGFFNHEKKKNGPFVDTVYKMDNFLSSIGFLQSPPNSIKY